MILTVIIFWFFCRYYYLSFRAHQMPEGSKENAIIILQKAKLDNWVMGKTKVKYHYSVFFVLLIAQTKLIVF